MAELAKIMHFRTLDCRAPGYPRNENRSPRAPEGVLGCELDVFMSVGRRQGGSFVDKPSKDACPERELSCLQGAQYHQFRTLDCNADGRPGNKSSSTTATEGFLGGGLYVFVSMDREKGGATRRQTDKPSLVEVTIQDRIWGP